MVGKRLKSKEVAEQFFARFNYRLAMTTDAKKLLHFAGEELKALLSVTHVSFVVRHKDKLLSGGSYGRVSVSQSRLDVLESYLLGSDYEIIEVDEPRVPLGVREVMERLSAQAVLPLRGATPRQLLGLMIVGAPPKDKLTTKARSVLIGTSYELGIVFHNALSLRTVTLHNQALERLVSKATQQLRASNTKLRKLDDAKNEFISMASHQLRTPLTSVKGYLSMVLEGDAGPLKPEQERLLREAFASSERMVQLIGDFLNVSRLQTGKFVIDSTPTDIEKLVSEEVQALALVAEARDLKLDFRALKRTPVLTIDEAKVRQVVMNFIDNAIYYSDEKTTIKIRVTVEHGFVVVTVADTGIGVPKQEQTKLFTKFYRARNARKQRPDGTGVGLFLAKKIITMHGGDIVFTSREGDGSTFGFKLPIGPLTTR